MATAGKPSAGFAFLTEQLRDLLFLPRGLLALIRERFPTKAMAN